MTELILGEKTGTEQASLLPHETKMHKVLQVILNSHSVALDHDTIRAYDDTTINSTESTANDSAAWATFLLAAPETGLYETTNALALFLIGMVFGNAAIDPDDYYDYTFVSGAATDVFAPLFVYFRAFLSAYNGTFTPAIATTDIDGTTNNYDERLRLWGALDGIRALDKPIPVPNRVYVTGDTNRRQLLIYAMLQLAKRLPTYHLKIINSEVAVLGLIKAYHNNRGIPIPDWSKATYNPLMERWVNSRAAGAHQPNPGLAALLRVGEGAAVAAGPTISVAELPTNPVLLDVYMNQSFLLPKTAVDVARRSTGYFEDDDTIYLNLWSYILGGQATNSGTEQDMTWVAGRHLITAMNYMTECYANLEDAIQQLSRSSHPSYKFLVEEIKNSFAQTPLSSFGGFMSEGHAVVSGQAQVWATPITEVLGDMANSADQTANAYNTPFLSILASAVNPYARFVTHAPSYLYLKEQLEWEEYDYHVTATSDDWMRLYQQYVMYSNISDAVGGWVYETTTVPLGTQTWRRASYDAVFGGHAASTWVKAALHEINLLGAALTLDARDGFTHADAERTALEAKALSQPIVIEGIADTDRQRAKTLRLGDVSESSSPDE
jgi:hypothetical protein